jgi:lysozyme
MANNNTIWLIVAGLAALAFTTVKKTYTNTLKQFLVAWEGFSAVPYWDVKQWSWGYGTKVPGSTNNAAINPGGTISREDAMTAAMDHVNKDYLYLKPLLHVDLSPNQWAAYLSFAYNLGPGNADNLVTNINNQDWQALETQWKLYINAGGVPSSNLIARRNAEWELFSS